MAKEVPYFKFYTGEWFTGDIILEDFETQGLFINVCAFYWSRDCSLSLEMLLKKFKGYAENINYLIKSDLIKSDGSNIFISFLDEQMQSKEVQKVINRANGLKGGRPPKTESKPNRLNLGSKKITEPKPKHNQYKGKERKEDDNVPPPAVFFTINDFKETVFIGENEFTLLATRQTHKTIEQLKVYLVNFLQDKVALSHVAWKNESDAKRHFINWVKKQQPLNNGYFPQTTN